MITVIDYGAGNLRSVANAITRLGYQLEVTNRPGDLAKASTVDPIRRYIAENRPFLGVCIGLQVLLTGTEEGGWYECLGLIPGKVKKLPSGLKIPHMGWNQVKQRHYHPIFEGIPDETNFYFVHSYYGEPEDTTVVAGETKYGIPFCSVIARRNLIATQFHPEKSGKSGLKIYDNFLKLTIKGR
jgi:glutamine amidotransferase